MINRMKVNEKKEVKVVKSKEPLYAVVRNTDLYVVVNIKTKEVQSGWAKVSDAFHVARFLNKVRFSVTES